jgi:hypothetical protein
MLNLLLLLLLLLGNHQRIAVRRLLTPVARRLLLELKYVISLLWWLSCHLFISHLSISTPLILLLLKDSNIYFSRLRH